MQWVLDKPDAREIAGFYCLQMNEDLRIQDLCRGNAEDYIYR